MVMGGLVAGARDLYGGTLDTIAGIRSGAGKAASTVTQAPASIYGGTLDTLAGIRGGIGNTALGIADVGGQITSGAIETVTPVTTGITQALGGAGQALVQAPGQVVSGVTAPVGQLSKDILPLAAIAAFVLLRK
jgi:hypothetical protein